MRWIKASERKPDAANNKDKRVNAKYSGCPETLVYDDKWWCYIGTGDRVSSEDWQHMEWLDESPDVQEAPAAPPDEGQEEQDFLWQEVQRELNTLNAWVIGGYSGLAKEKELFIKNTYHITKKK